MTDYGYLTQMVGCQGREATARAFESAARQMEAGLRFLPTVDPVYVLRLNASRVRLGFYDPPGLSYRRRRMRICGSSLDAICVVGHYLRRTVNCAVVHESPEGRVQGTAENFHLDVLLETTPKTDLTIFEVLPPIFVCRD